MCRDEFRRVPREAAPDGGPGGGHGGQLRLLPRGRGLPSTAALHCPALHSTVQACTLRSLYSKYLASLSCVPPWFTFNTSLVCSATYTAAQWRDWEKWIYKDFDLSEFQVNHCTSEYFTAMRPACHCVGLQCALPAAGHGCAAAEADHPLRLPRHQDHVRPNCRGSHSEIC